MTPPTEGYRTDFRYRDRRTKARYIALKYAPLLAGSVLDVGCDEGALRDHLAAPERYVGIDRDGRPDRRVDLEREPIPFPDRSFDCVLCTDVLEHVDNLHAVFDELCRVALRHLIVSLPNPWGELWRVLRHADYAPGRPLKFYGLPVDEPPDRHKWFFSPQEAERFVAERGERHGFAVAQLDYDRTFPEGAGLRGRLRRLARRYLLRADLEPKNLEAGTLWALLERTAGRLDEGS